MATKTIKEKFKRNQKALAVWAAKCAEHVLPYFELKFPKDKRPRNAIQTLRKWIKTGEFSMREIRGASLAAHAAARRAKENSAARFAARAAGQAVATAHVPEHAFGAPYYAFKAVGDEQIAKEFKWQTRHIPKNLRQAWQDWQKKRLPKQLKRLINHSNLLI